MLNISKTARKFRINPRTGEIYNAQSGVTVGTLQKNKDTCYQFTAYRLPYRRLTKMQFDSVKEFLRDIDTGGVNG